MAKKILIVEDDTFLVRFLNNKLKEEGFEVEAVTGGTEALGRLEKDKYNLIVTDLIMPELDGFTFLSELQERKNQVPVLVYSNLTQPEDEEEVIRLGAKAFLDKSHSLDGLVALIRKYVN